MLTLLIHFCVDKTGPDVPKWTLSPPYLPAVGDVWVPKPSGKFAATESCPATPGKDIQKVLRFCVPCAECMDYIPQKPVIFDCHDFRALVVLAVLNLECVHGSRPISRQGSSLYICVLHTERLLIYISETNYDWLAVCREMKPAEWTPM